MEMRTRENNGMWEAHTKQSRAIATREISNSFVLLKADLPKNHSRVSLSRLKGQAFVSKFFPISGNCFPTIVVDYFTTDISAQPIFIQSLRIAGESFCRPVFQVSAWCLQKSFFTVGLVLIW
jgi:hypothetical protein